MLYSNFTKQFSFQKITKTLNMLLVEHEVIKKNQQKIISELNSSANLFDMVLNAFNSSGEVIAPNGNKVFLEKLKDRLGYTPKQLKELDNIWNSFKIKIKNIKSKQFTKDDLEYILKNNNKLLSLSNDIVTLLQKASQKTTKYIIALLIISMLSSIIVFFIISYILSKTLIEPIIDVNKKIEELSNGNLAINLKKYDDNEIGEITENLQHMVNNLNNTIGIFCIDYVNQFIYNKIESYRPFGQENPYPIFTFVDMRVLSISKMGKNKEFTKLIVSNGTNSIEVVVFIDFDGVEINDIINFTATISKNEYRGEIKFNLMFKELI